MKKNLQAPSYVWLDAPAHVPDTSVCDWVIFRRDFDLTMLPDSAELNLFATTRYRLRVNGDIVGYGPGRYVPGVEEYDTHDLDRWLHVGANCITVEACFIDINNFQHMPEAAGRFIAWGQAASGVDDVVDLSTPGGWRARRVGVWAEPVPCFSFAIGSIEAADARAWPPGWCHAQTRMDDQWLNTTPLRQNDASTSLPAPRSIPLPTGDMKRLAATFIAPLHENEHRFGYVAVHPSSRSSQIERTRGHYSRYAVFVHSDIDREVTAGVHWGSHFLNGRKLDPVDDPTRANRQNLGLPLQTGWNLWCGEIDQLEPFHPVLLGLPKIVGVRFADRPKTDAAGSMRFAAPQPRDKDQRWITSAPADASALDALESDWQTVPKDEMPILPARMMGWDELDSDHRIAAPTYPFTLPATSADTSGSWTFMIDLGREYLGHVAVELDAPAGTVIDLGYDERLREDGCLNWFASNPFTDTADRFVCAEGAQTHETFHPRGGRYLQVTVRPPASSGSTEKPITMYGISIRDARCLVDFDQPFATNNPLYQWIWDTGLETLRASTEDVHCDSPWRERGAYLGDSYIQTLVESCASTDHRLARRCLRLFAAGQFDDGQLPCVVPGWLLKPHGDFTLIYAIWLHDFWRISGDLDTLRICLPAVDRLLASPTWHTSSNSSLWDATEQNRLFICWGCPTELRRFDENGVLNAFRIHALRCAAAMCGAIGRHDDASTYTNQAEAVASDYRRRLWREDLGRFAPGTRASQPLDDPSIHVNILAMAYGLADETQEPALAEYVIDRMRTNAAHASRGESADDFAELYFLKFVLDAMVRLNRHDVAKQVIADHMQIMKDRNAYAFWESIHRGIKNRASLCHSWSAAPLEYLFKFENNACPEISLAASRT